MERERWPDMNKGTAELAVESSGSHVRSITPCKPPNVAGPTNNGWPDRICGDK